MNRFFTFTHSRSRRLSKFELLGLKREQVQGGSCSNCQHFIKKSVITLKATIYFHKSKYKCNDYIEGRSHIRL